MSLCNVVLVGEAPERFLKIYPKATVYMDASGGQQSSPYPVAILEDEANRKGEREGVDIVRLRFFPQSSRIELNLCGATFIITEKTIRLIDHSRYLSKFVSLIDDKLRHQIRELCIRKIDDKQFKQQLKFLLTMNKL